MLNKDSKSWVAPVIFALSFLVLFLDFLTPKGFGEYIFYLIPVSITLLHFRANFALQIAFLDTILCVLGYAISQDSDLETEVALVNRALSILTIWGMAFLVRQIVLNRQQEEFENWKKDGAAQLLASLKSDFTPTEMGSILLSFLARYVGANVAALYLFDEKEGLFKYTCGHGANSEDSVKSFTLGEGIMGQAALDQKLMISAPLDRHHLKVKTALGESNALYVATLPLSVEGKTLAILELAFLTQQNPRIDEFLNFIQGPVAISFRSAEHKLKLTELLQQSQQYSEELQAQQEELRVVNEELEQQTKALKESHTRLENQQAELEQTNQQLEEQAQILENQKNQLNENNKELLKSKHALERQSEELRQASQYKSEFLANMSHELRTPLNSTLILSKLLAENRPGNLTDEQINYADIIYNSGSDLLNLINDILDLSKVEAGKLVIQPEVVRLDPLTTSLDKLFRPQTDEKKLDLKFDVSSTAPESIITDRQRLEQVLRNLLSNAIKFTPKGSVTLSIKEKDGSIDFTVTDTGIGISPDEQEVIFEAFRQADGTTNRKFGGTGLGLSISRQLAEKLGGSIHLESEKGKGSSFTLRLPLEYAGARAPQVSLPPEPKLPKPEKKKTAPRSTFSFPDDRGEINKFSRKMLIIEDDEAFAKVLMDLAHEMNFGAIVASTAEEGIDLAKTFNPNAVILDIKLPDHNGMVVLDQLKLDPKTRHIPVHVISSEDFSKPAREMGAFGYYLKPVKREKILMAFQQMTSLMDQSMKRVLIVEDDAVQRDHLVDLIKDPKVEIIALGNAKDALEELSRSTFDCMIMDLNLPDMSGYELLSKISNESSTYSFPPVIVYTARDLTPEEEEKLRLYSGSIIIKGAKSPERLLSEVTLFLHKVETDLPLERQKMLRELRGREKGLLGRKILVVDDDVRNIFALTSVLETHGASVETARNGVEALEKLEKLSSVDLVLMDIMMPEMDGLEAIRRIRKKDQWKDLVILALTAKAMRDDKEQCLVAGANDYLAKPLEMDKLLSLIRVWLPQKRTFSL
jgi:signal transduction histidine kinase/DNA-binding response OmpR family regulator